MLVQGLDNNPHFPQFGDFNSGYSLLGWNYGEAAFQKASLKILFVFPSGMGVRSVSETHTVLYLILKEKFGDDIFIDIYMEPMKWDASYMAKNYPQTIIGFFSHHTYEDFDIVGFSLSITMSEFVETAVLLKQAGDPVWSRDRLNRDDLPLICAGGVALDNSTILDNVLDIEMLGLGERNLPLMCEVAYEAKAKFGSVKKAKDWIINQLQYHVGFYNPKLYHYTHGIQNGHFVSHYDSCDIPELKYVKPDVTLPAEVLKVHDKKYKLNVPGGAHKISLQSSFGCQGQNGVCNFCHEANMYGAWRERSTEDLHHAIEVAKASSMGEGFSFFSFNGNFRSEYVADLQYAADYFNKVGSINIRCTTPDTLVLTPDGWTPVSNVSVGDLVWSGEKFVSVLNVHRNLPEPLYRVRTQSGRIVSGLHDHPVQVGDKFVSLDKVSVGDILNFSRSPNIVYNPVYTVLGGDELDSVKNSRWVNGTEGFKKDSLVVTTETAFMLGWLVGDGSFNDSSRNDITFVFNKNESWALDYIKGYLDSILTSKGRLSSNGSCTNLTYSNKGFALWLDIVVGRHSARTKQIPEFIFNTTPSLKWAFLRGLFSADGCVQIKSTPRKIKRETCLVTVSSALAQGTILLLNSLGVTTTMSYATGAVGRDMINANGVHFTTDTPGIQVRIRPQSLELFFKGIEAKEGKLLLNAFQWGIITSHIRSQDYTAGKVIKVEELPAGETVALEVEGHVYVTNGIVSHNCDGLAGSIKLNGQNNYIRLLKELGTTSVACPWEGISQRMRNWLNKNLTVDDILTVDRELFRNRMIRVKHGLIWTAFETKEDYQEHEELCKQILALRDEMGANSMIQMNATWLVANYGTAIYYQPRKTTAMAWKQFFSKYDGKDFYFYPWMYLSDLGIKLKESSQPKDTIVQQNLQDIPTEFLEEAWLKPILAGKFENLSTDMVVSLREHFQKWGINPRSQFLEYDAYQNPRQHLKIGYVDNVVRRLDGGSYDAFFKRCVDSNGGTGSCLRTPATDFKHNISPCVACGSCMDIDKTRKEMGLEVKCPHAKWMPNRDMVTDYNVMDVKTSLMKNSPSFYYRLIFKISEPGRFVGKEVLVRRWLSKAAEIDKSLVRSFRTIATATHKWLDYEGLTSVYAGYELCIMGFLNSLDIENFKDIAKQVNQETKISGIQLADIQSAQESGGTSFYVLHSFEVIAEKEDFDKFIQKMCTEERRLYEGSTSMPETFAMSIDYKILRGKKGYRVLVLCPPRFNIMWSEGLKKWTAPRVFDHIVDWNIMAIFTKTPDGRFVSVLDGKPFETSGFVHAEQSGAEFAEKGDSGVECDGA